MSAPPPKRWTAKVVGVTFTGNYSRNLELLRTLAGSEPVPAFLVRNPGNVHDANAVQVHALETMIGHLPAVYARMLAPYLDGGVAYDALMHVSTHPDHPDNPGAVLHCELAQHDKEVTK